jgi:hypothetical protein
MSDLERYTLHAVRGALSGMNVYHAVWEIVIEQEQGNRLAITAWVPERITLPKGFNKPLMPIHFKHMGGIMRDFTDVNFWPIARELVKEMTKAFREGTQYGQA